ncbi:4-(cytidine 5'-diphospho)-2-C-methyl-D-erythritol kinase [Phreatobacter aquaticus]|uniref:4-diphosphocytidyl-2-C-methyl-D-erythritol kinase n=1 Tax=Phreatobacter aquaticus TaxID=2570229 RepID=A0A4D7QLZ9_9HYPH|nr:4-(cytidine 5'-diphospho)-2-C-methyl-D-erythritol kinase [Phreatobacter aquaticus]QCK88255.1 4-(cytidine 5'-diphospho)-2-C-methyl-D-erythritol kinase [Phreatobacter aquaticus]
MLRDAFAPAKVNLTLAVRRRRSDGYHDLESLVVFARTGDDLSFAPGGTDFALIVKGPAAAAAGPDADNLVLKAAHLLAHRVPDLPRGLFTLTKRLPVAAGLGGGSSDAAAALRLLAEAGRLSLDDPRVMEAARLTGSDVPVCLDPRTRMMRGTGADLGQAIDLPSLPALMINPRVAVPTPDVFRKLALEPGRECPADPAARLERHALESSSLARRRADLVTLLVGTRNDLEPPAIALAPVIGEALGLLRQAPGCRLARMSGSGATVFGLFDTCRASAAAAQQIRAVHPDWWIKSTMLG